MIPEPLLENLNPMNPGIVMLEYADAIREEKKKINWWKNLVTQYIQVGSWSYCVELKQINHCSNYPKALSYVLSEIQH